MTKHSWLEKFHSGDREVIRKLYVEHAPLVLRSVGSFLAGADQETVTHEVFFRLLTDHRLRSNFAGGSFAAWLTRVSRNHAIDHLRRHRREQLVEPAVAAELTDRANAGNGRSVEARVMLEQFCRDRLPARWAPVFEARFVQDLSQREAAQLLKMRRTTLAYQELRIRSLLRSHFLQDEDSV